METTQLLGIGIAVLGVLSLLIFSTTSRRVASGPIGTFYGLMTLPIGIALLWRLAVGIGWWTVLVFVAASFVSGFFTAKIIRAQGLEALVTGQPLQGTLALLCAAGSWFLR